MYPYARILPKRHYLVHLPTQIMMFGPLIHSWCMKFEGKHLYFKTLARAIENFKNLPLLLAQRHLCMESVTSIQINDERPVLNALSSDEIIYRFSQA